MVCLANYVEIIIVVVFVILHFVEFVFSGRLGCGSGDILII